MDTASHVRRGSGGVLIGAAWLAGMFAAAPLVGGFGPVAVAEAIILRSPGWLSTMAVSLLGFSAKPVLVASVLVAILAVAGLLTNVWPEHSGRWGLLAVVAGICATAALFWAVGASPSLGTIAGIAVAIAPPLLVARVLAGAPSLSAAHPERRRFLRRVGGVAVAGTVALAAFRLLFGRLGATGASSPDVDPTALSVSPPTGDPRFDFEGMPPAVTPPEDHYVVDINIGSPGVDPETWTLDVDGAVDRPYGLTHQELLDHEASVEQTTTMVCVSNQVGGDLIGTGHWTGVQLSDLVAAAEPTDAAVDVVTHAADGYSEAIPIELVEREDILVAYGLGDQTLSPEHGFPARLLIPGRYGMKMTKWLTRIEIAERDHEAYWESRGWNEEAIVNTMSYVRGAERTGDQVVVGGVAFGGLETGIEEIATVEVSVDGGATWQEAELEPQIAPHAWRRWRYEFSAPDRTQFEVVVRAVRSDGTVQTDERSSPSPSGSTGWHRKVVRV